MTFPRCFLLSLCLLLAARPLSAQTAAPERVENVRLDYAQVLNVEPVYESQRARRTAEQACEAEQKAEKAAQAAKAAKTDGADKARTEEAKSGEEGRWARMWSSVKGVFSGDEPSTDGKDTAAQTPTRKQRCRPDPDRDDIPQPIAYDVDYMYKDMKYRARLPEDPGNRLRIRISVAPYQPGVDAGD